MPKKRMAEADPLVSALDQTWNIGHCEPAVIVEDKRTDHRVQRGKGVGGNLRVCITDTAEER